jgi:hypothetical protein
MTNRPKTFRIHVGLVLAELICIPAFLFELSRALDGNTLSWAYVFEWPLLGLYAVHMWRRLLRDERGELTPRQAPVDDGDDAELTAWNEYLERVHRDDEATDTR